MSEKKVDVAINVYGKPYQTIVAINSLLHYSKQHIHKIYFIVEKKQIDEKDIQIIREHINYENVEFFTPDYYLGWWAGKRRGLLNQILMFFKKYRYSIRYQYAFEKSNQDFWFMMHNDMLFKGDLIGEYLDKIGDHIGIGEIGQCHNCPAFETYCTPDKYVDFQPNLAQLEELYSHHPTLRAEVDGFYKRQKRSWPLPECRLNEFAALINMRIAKPLTAPIGKVLPPGFYGIIDIGIDFFYDMNRLGFRFKHLSFSKFAKHSWALPLRSSGHLSLFNHEIYAEEERIAKELVESNNY